MILGCGDSIILAQNFSLKNPPHPPYLSNLLFVSCGQVTELYTGVDKCLLMLDLFFCDEGAIG